MAEQTNDVVRRLADLMDLAECAKSQRGCPPSCGCTDCDLRDDLARLHADEKAKRGRHWRRKLRHRHDYQRVGYGGAGWWLLRCACGEEELGT